MRLQHLRLSQFRCHTFFSTEFSPHLNLILGSNGQGKTAILEALYFVSHLHSFRTSVTRELVQHQQERFSIRLQTESDTLKINWSPQQKELWINDTLVKAIDFLGTFSCVALTTSDIELTRGGSALRDFLSQLLNQSERKNLLSFLRYQKILKERNAWLKDRVGDKLVFEQLTYQLVKIGKPLQRSRYHLSRLVGKVATHFYQKLSHSKEVLKLDYEPNVWNHALEKELLLGYSLNGLHRDQVVLFLNQYPLSTFGSEGQQRTAAIALKLAEIYLLQRKQSKAPVILVDDIWGELDQQRRMALLKLVQEPFQIFVTATSAETWENQLANYQKIML